MIYNSQSLFSLGSVNSLTRTQKAAVAPQFAANDKLVSPPPRNTHRTSLKTRLGDSGDRYVGSSNNHRKSASKAGPVELDDEWIPASNQEHEALLQAERAARAKGKG